ncbi:MAG: hypothetical protein NDJ89_04015 [Oligoflexia bacterium]|nr:hypothetical protein [Oligoflexia bacterium]
MKRRFTSPLVSSPDRPGALPAAAIVLALAVLAGGCNVFKSFDSPDGDAQLLSAARACFDRGDLECAKTHYQNLSADSADFSASEQAYITLQEQGMGMDAFMEFVGNGAQGEALTTLGEQLAEAGAGENKRLAIHGAYLKKDSVTSDAELQAFVEFLGALGLLAEILGEASGADGLLQKGDIVATPSTCSAAGELGCAATPACDNPAGGKITSSAGADIATTAPAGASPKADQLYYSISRAYAALQRMAPSGKFSDTSGGFASITDIGGKPSDSALIDRCFRWQLLNFGIGR